MRSPILIIGGIIGCVGYVQHIGNPDSTTLLTHTDMAQDFVVKKEITIHAAPDKVWRALTDPELTKNYFYGCRVYSSWQPGSEISFKRKFLWKKIEMNGKIIKADPGKLLQYTLKNSGSENPSSTSMVTDELTFANGETTVHITDDVGQGEGAEKRYNRSVKGWDKILKGLKKTVEKNSQ